VLLNGQVLETKFVSRSQLQAIRVELGQALQNLNEYAAALDCLEAAEVDAKVLAVMAGAQWGLGQREEAEQLLKRSIALEPAEPVALLLIAKIALEDGKPGEALEPLQRLLERDPHDYSPRYQLSRAYQRLGDTKAAAVELDRMNASKLMFRKLGELYVKTMERTRDAGVREELAEICDKLDRHELAQLWRRSAEYCRRNGEVPVAPQ
jgi:predicted Zn-dependent protease